MTPREKKSKPHYSLLDELMASATNPIPERHRIHQLTKMHQALHALERTDRPSADDWRILADSVNLCETLVAMGVVEDASGLLKDATEALAKAAKRLKTHGIIRMAGPEIQAVRAVLEDYAAMLEVVPARTVIQCHRKTEKRIREIQSGKVKAHDVEVVAL